MMEQAIDAQLTDAVRRHHGLIWEFPDGGPAISDRFVRRLLRPCARG